MGSAFRAALIAGLKTDAVELVPSVPEMFGYYYPDADAVLADPNGRVIVTDGRNHLELTDERYDIIVTDPPPPIESSGAVGHLVEGVLRGRSRPPDPRRDHDAVGPVRRTVRRLQRPHPDVRRGLPERRRWSRAPAATGMYMLGSSAPISFDEANIRAVLARPGVLEDISSAYDSPAKTVDDWVEVIARQTWMTGRRASRTRPAPDRSSRTTGHAPSTSCCAGCSAAGCPDGSPNGGTWCSISGHSRPARSRPKGVDDHPAHVGPDQVQVLHVRH